MRPAAEPGLDENRVAATLRHLAAWIARTGARPCGLGIAAAGRFWGTAVSRLRELTDFADPTSDGSAEDVWPACLEAWLGPAGREAMAAARAPLACGGTLILFVPQAASPPAAELVPMLVPLVETAAEADRLREDFQRELQREKLAALSEFAAGAGHEINNPLGTILGRMQLLLRHESDAARREDLLAIGGQAQRIRDMIADVMLFADPPPPEMETVPAVAAAREVAEKFVSLASSCAAELVFEAAEDRSGAALAVRADPVQFRAALAELARNACEACRAAGQAGRIEIRVETDRLAASAPAVAVEVRDTGIGFLPHEREHAFDPFFSGRQAGRGLGFGLCKVWRIVTMHGGTIEIVNDRDPTIVRAIWPAAEAAP